MKEGQKMSMDIYLVLKVAASIRHIQVRDKSTLVGTRAGTIDRLIAEIKKGAKSFLEKN